MCLLYCSPHQDLGASGKEQGKKKEKRCWLKQSKKGAVGCLWILGANHSLQVARNARVKEAAKICIRNKDSNRFGNTKVWQYVFILCLLASCLTARTSPASDSAIGCKYNSFVCIYIWYHFLLWIYICICNYGILFSIFFCKYCGSGRLEPLWPMFCSVLSCYCCWKSSWWLFCMKASVISFWGIKSVTMQWFLHTKRQKQESRHNFFKSIDGIISCISNCISNWCFSICMLTCNILTI